MDDLVAIWKAAAAERAVEIQELKSKLGRISALVNAQAEDDGLWFIAENASEAYLQQELRKLHATIEEPKP